MPCPTHRKMPWAGSDRHARLPGDWTRTRRLVLERDGYQCQGCGDDATDVDHVIPNDDHSPANLMSLCERCHKAKTAREAARARTRKVP